MNPRDVHDFIAHGSISRGDVFVPATLVGSYPRYGFGHVKCSVVVARNEWNPDFGPLSDYQNRIQLKGKTEDGNDIWSPDFRPSNYISGFLHEPSPNDRLTFKGIATFIVEGDLSNFNASKGVTNCYVSISPTPLTIDRGRSYIKSYDGTIGKRGSKRKGIRWSTKLGKAELIDNYEYIDEKVGFDPAIVQVQKCQITLKWKTQRRDASLQVLLSDLESILDEPLLLLSFLSRESITWYEAKADFTSKDYSTEVHRTAIARRDQNLMYENAISANLSPFDIPIMPEVLRNGIFQALLEQYEKSPLKNTIRQTIQYLLASSETGYFEARLGLIYAALESLVDGLSKFHQIAYLMGSSKFKKLSKELEETIFDKLSKILEEVIQEKVPEEDIAKGIIGKLPELRRPPIRDRLLTLLEKHKLNKLRFGADIVTTVEGILSRRNTYIHTGAVDYDKHFDDFLLLRELIELWVLTLLGCPNDSINTSAYRKIILAWSDNVAK